MKETRNASARVNAESLHSELPLDSGMESNLVGVIYLPVRQWKVG